MEKYNTFVPVFVHACETEDAGGWSYSIAGQAYCNSLNGINGAESHMWFPYV